jgi:hypothetical protein
MPTVDRFDFVRRFLFSLSRFHHLSASSLSSCLSFHIRQTISHSLLDSRVHGQRNISGRTLLVLIESTTTKTLDQWLRSVSDG